jgi:hypothetical protein
MLGAGGAIIVVGSLLAVAGHALALVRVAPVEGS